MQLPHDFKSGGCIVTLTFYKVHFAQNTEHRLHGGKFGAKGASWEVSLWNKRSTVPFQTGDCRRWEKQKREWPWWEYWEVESTSLWVGQTCYVKALAWIVAEMGRPQVLIQGSPNRCWDHRRGERRLGPHSWLLVTRSPIEMLTRTWLPSWVWLSSHLLLANYNLPLRAMTNVQMA